MAESVENEFMTMEQVCDYLLRCDAATFAEIISGIRANNPALADAVLAALPQPELQFAC